jgi:hypothetical protein
MQHFKTALTISNHPEHRLAERLFWLCRPLLIPVLPLQPLLPVLPFLRVLLATLQISLVLPTPLMAQALPAMAANPVEARALLDPFVISDPLDPQHGLIKRSAHAGLDWYFTSLALVLAPADALLAHRLHFEGALRQLAVAGPMPVRPDPGLRRVSDSAQLWELQTAADNPFAWNCANIEFPAGAPLSWLHTDACGRVWRNWGRVAPDAHWSLIDTSDDRQSLRHPDSHDSQAAVFLLALSRWLALTGDRNWLHAPVWRLPGSDTQNPTQWLSRIDLIKNMVRHNLLNHMQDGLFRTFRHNRHPLGGQWDVQYLMDNIECQASLRALIPLFEQAGHSAFADVLRHYEQALSLGLDQLTSQQAQAPTHYVRWAKQADWPAIASEIGFYPHVGGQYWGGLFETPGQGSLPLRWVQMEPQLGPFSDWWRQPFLHLAAGLPPYLSRLMHMPGSQADQSPQLRQYISELTPQNSVVSDYVAAWQIRRLLAP